MRWVQMRGQILNGAKPNGRHVNALRGVDQQLRQVRHPSRVDPPASDARTRIKHAEPGAEDRRHVAATPAEAVISFGGQNENLC